MTRKRHPPLSYGMQRPCGTHTARARRAHLCWPFSSSVHDLGLYRPLVGLQGKVSISSAWITDGQGSNVHNYSLGVLAPLVIRSVQRPRMTRGARTGGEELPAEGRQDTVACGGETLEERGEQGGRSEHEVAVSAARLGCDPRGQPPYATGDACMDVLIGQDRTAKTVPC